MQRPTDCTRCGTCCFSESERHARVTGDDYARLGDDAAEWTLFVGNQAFMRIAHVDGVGRCAALIVDDTGFHCAVYSTRPAVCRELERGSPACEGEILMKGARLNRINRPTPRS